MANNYVIGRGRLYFDRFNASGASTGLRYLGNTPSISVTKDVQTLDHYDSDSGMKTKDKSVTLQENMTLQFTTDNISPENLALWFGGTQGAGSTTSALTGQTATITDARFGIAYPIGPDRVDNVTVAITAGGATVAPTNYTVDEAGGLITFSGGFTEGTDDLTITYDVPAVTTTGTIVDSSTTIYGRLLYVSDNPVGANQRLNFPYVKLTPNGDYALKGDDWQQLTFTVEALKQGTSRFNIDILAATSA